MCPLGLLEEIKRLARHARQSSNGAMYITNKFPSHFSVVLIMMIKELHLPRLMLSLFFGFFSTVCVSATDARELPCSHGPTNRRCWTDGFDISTDFDQSFPVTGKTVEV